MRYFSHLNHMPSNWARVFPQALLAIVLSIVLVSHISLPAAAQTPASVRIVPATQTISAGNVSGVDILIENVSNLYGAEIHLTFNRNLLAVQDADGSNLGIQITPGSLLTSQPHIIIMNQADNNAGTIDLGISLINPAVPVSGSGVLARINFSALCAGTSPVHLISTAPLPSVLSDRNGFAIPATFLDGAITVVGGNCGVPTPLPPTPTPQRPAEVPEADTWLLFGTGGTSLMTYLMWQWRKRRARTQ